ncbi:MAG: asparagine synthase (glutamine-hydrolyzing), partial [Gammaproteobacteria bacterium]|nr:asparagine synthase (glutamine-hydrolyzing) [Gammaproteobacteria bacterium]
MCGIFGYFDSHKNILSDERLKVMGDAILYRGPDGSGCYHNERMAVALGNQRLAILDIEHGQQPFYSEDRNIIVVQNGEIFNHVELAEDLNKDGFHCITHCDTEVILRIYQRDGIKGLSLLNGMFAIAIYDVNEQALYLVRDRVGEKPLYFSNEEGRLIFSSEIKSIVGVSDSKSVCVEAMNQFFAFNYVPPPLTIFSGIKHVMPGHYLRVSQGVVEDHCWWDLSSIKTQERSEEEWISLFNNILDDAVRIRLRSDVAFGAFLSGGVDSSSVVGLMSKHLDTAVNTFCIGFDDKKYDESLYAQEAAERFNTHHTMKKVQANLINLWPM